MASIVKRIRKDGTPTYYVKYRAGDGTTRWEQFDRAKDAQARKAQVELERARTGGRWTPPAAIKFQDYASGWLESYAKRAVKRRVFENYARSVRLRLLPAFGGLELAGIARSDVKGLVVRMLAEGKSASTVRNTLVPLREMLGHAVEDGLIPSNPAANVRIPQNETARKIAPPSSTQIEGLIAQARDEARDAIVVAATTGLRRGELFALRWGDVDFQTGTIHVHATNHGALVEETTKTEAGERFVPLFESARKVLAARKLRSRFARPQDFVLATSVGTPMDPGNFVRREFKPALRRAGLDNFRWHDLRHYAVSELIAQGADIKLLQAIAGHASAKMTLDTYGHLMTARVAEAARLYDPLRPSTAGDETADFGHFQQ